MFFTIAIPTYNREYTLRRCLNSLEVQDFKDFEVLIIDDGSIDETELLVNEYISESNLNLIYIKKRNGGKYSAINKALKLAQGKYFMILDSDDWLNDNALNLVYEECLKIDFNDRYSGVIGKCALENNQVLGRDFPEEGMETSYIEMHYNQVFINNGYGDCCEVNKTNILKKYLFPEYETVKFIPEAYMFDQVGLESKLLCTNQILKIVEYQDLGITNNNNFKQQNILGFLINYKMRIENIIPNINRVSLKIKIIAWWRYWDALNKSKASKEFKINNVSILGYSVKISLPLINLFYKIKFPELYKRGR